jgi:transcription antitermination factor NusG
MATSDVVAGERWYALRVRSRCEKMASAVLHSKGYADFLPLFHSRRRWSDRTKNIYLPLFAGYVFCRFDARNRLPVLVTPGVVDIVGVGKVPVPVDDSEIAAIQSIMQSGAVAEPWPYLKVGTLVQIDYGAMSGLEGILVEIKARHRLIVSVSLLQRSVAVEIDRDWIRPVSRRSSDSRYMVA